MSTLTDINQNEKWLVDTTLKERYNRDVELQVVDCEIRLHRGDRELTSVPSLYWSDGGCHFVVFKTGDQNYRGQFFYRPHQQYNTGKREYTDLAECTVALLQAQADHHAKQQGNL
ncbi:MAG: hypothetical protein KZQ58_13340 [gamma proteobacterium symbiont of Bathyaustriella thionipta]|nr:hypothetical protein [gamma proteobacterium symbiont of Bathyaustriella thionipta]